MGKKDEIKNKLSQIRGEVIDACTEIEDLLAGRITDYFFKKQSREKTFFLAYNYRKI